MQSPLQPADLVLLVVLGTAGRAPVPLRELAAAARLLAPQDWQPTTETICNAVRRALAGGLATIRGETSAPRLEATPLGRVRLAELLRRPIPRPTGGFVRACMSAKLCFLDHLPQPERGDLAEELASLYRDAIEVLRRLRRLPRPLAGPALDELRHEILRLESDLAWLDGMTVWHPHRQAAE